ncbi:hypothetical protein JR316_0006486 [Psilocybe cubensis]|uniref:Uncharacterized protein n=2 Tax=Psilocybe cubensis TaxID=181762 RepID=A0ACB8H252_PSICU|nr:hypothetical protein JR316_0006486 [Psilocybe cubensis]KAH9481956.1 hypothetical protein JR316_0006486 [Psilocybe cubensis]
MTVLVGCVFNQNFLPRSINFDVQVSLILQTMPNPGAFKGARKDFLMTQKEEYAKAVEANHVGETLMNINRRFFKRFPLTMPADYEPTEESLRAVDDDAPEPDVPEPNRETMSEEEFSKVVAEVKARNSRREAISGQIKQWFVYQYNKEHHPKKLSESTLLSLLQKLAGKDTSRPRMKSDVNTWRKSQRNAIDDRYEAEVARALARGEPMKKSNKAADRDRIAREMFAELSKTEQEAWHRKSEEDHAEAIAAYKASWSPSKSPADRQRAINSLVKVMEPILDIASETTGWKLMLVAGGPEPAKGGDLSVITMHSGETPGDIKMNLGQTERHKFKNYMIPLFGTFLHKCYTPEECRSRALPKDDMDGLVPAAALLQNENESTSVHGIAFRVPPTGVSAETENLRAPEVLPEHESASTSTRINDNTRQDDAENPFPFDPLPESPQASPCVSRAVSPVFIRSPARIPTASSSVSVLDVLDVIRNAEQPSNQAGPIVIMQTVPVTTSAAAPPATIPHAQSPSPSVAPTSLQSGAPLQVAPAENSIDTSEPSTTSPNNPPVAKKSGKKKAKGAKKSTTSAPPVERPKRKAQPQPSTTPAPPKKRVKPSWHYEDEQENPIDKYGRRIDAQGKVIPDVTDSAASLGNETAGVASASST